MFKNDWIVASLNNPTMDIDDLTSIGELNTSNTQLLSREEYLKSNFIKENSAFKDQYGEFSKEKFDKFYELQTARWRDFLNNEFPTGIELDAFDTASNRANAKVKNIGFNISPNYNPDRVQIGVEGWRTTSKRTKSEAEIALSQKIFNPETGEFELETPEDYALFSKPLKWIESLFSDPLVLALYDEDEVDEQGNKHRKGERKLNSQGTYYYEKLNGRSPLGKEVLSVADILTKEDSALNKIDFFDSDDLEKSTAGVIAKNIALIAPMFTPAAPYYYKAIIAKELAKTLPMLYSVATNLFGEGDNEPPKWMNTLAAKGESLSTTSSVWSREHTFSFENLANLISDIALQWGQQKQIAKAVTWFGNKDAIKKAEELAFKLYKSKVGGNLAGLEAASDELWKQSTLGKLALKKYYDPVVETMKKKLRLGADLALAYMALISNTDVYADMLERGATKKEAAWVALGSTAAMFSVDRFLHLGEVFYDDLTAESIKLGRLAVKSELKEAFDEIYKAGTKESPAKWFKKGADFGKKAANTFVENLKDHNLGGVGKALGEGLEEVSEELSTDLTKSIYALLGDLGLYDRSVKDTGAFDNMLERYSMSLIGGTLGGGLFYGVEKFKGYNKTRDKDLVDLINDGKADELRSIVKDYVSKGKAGNQKISGLLYSRDSKGDITWLSTDKDEESQNKYVGDRVLEKIDALEAAIVGSGTKLSKDLLFDRMVLQEARYLEFKNASHVTGYYLEFNKLQNLYLEAKGALDKALDTADGTPNGRETDNPTSKEEANKLQTLQSLQLAVDNAQKRINDFLSGDTSLDYTRKLNFALDPVLNTVFLGLDRTKWLLDKVNLTKELTLNEQIDLNKLWNEHVKEVMLENLDKAFLAYKALEHTISPELLALLDYAKLYESIYDALKPLYDSQDLSIDKFLKDKPFYNMDSRLVDENGIEEPEEIYINRNTVLTLDDLLRYYRRLLRVFDLNNQILALYVQQFDDILRPVGYYIDSATNRAIIQNIRYRIKDIIKRELDYPFLVEGSKFDSSAYSNILIDLKEDLSNLPEIENLVLEKYYSNVKQQVNNIVSTLKSTIPNINTLKSVDAVNRKKNLTSIIEEINNSNVDGREVVILDIQSINQRIEDARNADASEEEINALKLELYDAIPVDFKTTSESVYLILKSIMNKPSDEFGVTPIADNALSEDELDWKNRLGYRLSIKELIGELKNPESKIYQFMASKLSALPETLAAFLESVSIGFGKDASFAILFGLDPKANAGLTMNRLLGTLKKYINNLSTRVQKNPVYSFYNKLKVSSHSPLENILSSITKELSTNSEEIFNMNYILELVYKDYVSADKVDGFMLNDTLVKQLTNADKALLLLSAYLYSASTNPNGSTYFGLNKAINEFANTHKDVLTREWNPLPEIDSSYASLLLTEAANLRNEINFWKLLSENNSMNKLRRLVDTEAVVNKIRYNIGKNLSFLFTIDDKLYDLSEGLDALPTFDEVNTENLLNLLVAFELRLHNNFKNILKEANLTPEQFFEKTNFWETYLGNYSELTNLVTSKLTENLENFTKYDLALYVLSILSDNPANYYRSVVNSIKENTEIAPLTVLLATSRLGEAAHTATYKAGFKALAKLINPPQTIAPNTVYINGVAGAGKTEVVLKNIRLRFYELPALIIGPTSSLAIKLLNSLNENISYTISGDNNIFSKLLPEWSKIDAALQKASQTLQLKVNKGESNITVDTDYFTLTYSLDNTGSANIRVDLNEKNIKFDSSFTQPLIFVDEAAHMNTLLIALLDAYAEKVHGTVFLASDSNQSGYFNNRIENLERTSLFTTRTSKLLESLRSSNIQKLDNNNKVSMLLDTIDDIWTSGTYMEKQELINKLPNLISKLNLRVYNQEDDINGDLLGGNLEEVIKRLPEDASIGFIGDQDSRAYLMLKNAKFTNLGEPLTELLVPGKRFMQGLEFDYVIIDKFDINKDKLHGYGYVEFLKRFYTLMSRGKNASIFLNTDLSGIVGINVEDSIKSVGFSVKEQVENFRNNYLSSLDKLDLDQEAEEETPIPQETRMEGDEIVISPAVENTPEFNTEASPELILQELDNSKASVYKAFTELNSPEHQGIEISNLSDLLIEANTVVPITGLRETMTNADGTARRYPMWLPGEKTSVRRNLNAIYDGDLPITKRVAKLRLLDVLTNILSAIIFESQVNDSMLTSLLGFDEAWKNRKLQLEVREATEYDNFGIGTDLKPTFIDIDGKPYVIAVTCRLDGLSKTISDTPYSAIFDICLLSDFNNLRKPLVLDAIKDKINTKIREGKITGDRIAKAEKFRDNLGESVKQYELFIRRIVSEHPDGYAIDLSPDMYESHKTTRLVERLSPRRLGGTLSIATVENNIIDLDGNYVEDYNNFMDTDKRKVVSPVYILGNRSDILKGKVSESIFGKAVVFASSNTTLNPEPLADMYIEQKKNPDSHTPEVRMVVLNNHGLSFTELITHRIQKLLNGEGEKAKKPWRMDTLGVRMFTAMWNFRAGLENFLTELSRWKSENNYSDSKVLDITKVESLMYNLYGNDWASNINSESLFVLLLYNTYRISATDLENLIKFNLEYCKDIPTFRLGIDFTLNHVGGYVRPFDVSNSTRYGKKLANLIALEEEYAVRYHSLLSSILELLTANEPPAIFKLANIGYTPMSTKLVKPDGSNYATNEYIGKDELRRNLAGLIHTNDKNIVIGETNDAGEFITKSVITADSMFSFFPKAVSAIATKSRIYLTKPKVSGLIKINTIDTKNNLKSFDFDIEALFKEGLLERRGNDNTLFNLFNLMFHGTIQSLETEHIYTEDAPFKYGIFVDPDLELSLDYKLINVRGLDGLDYALLRCGTNPIFFDVDVDVIPGGIALNLSKLIEKGSRQLKLETKMEPPTPVGYSSNIENELEKVAFTNYLLNNGLSDTEQSYADYVVLQNNKKLINFFRGGVAVDNIVNIVNMQLGENKLKEVSYENGKVVYTNTDGNTGELRLDTEDMYISLIPNKLNSFEDITKLSFNSMVSDPSGIDVMTHQDFLNQLEDLFQNDLDVQTLANSSSVESYLGLLVEMKDTLNNKIELLEDSDTKYNLSDYLLYVDTTCF